MHDFTRFLCGEPIPQLSVHQGCLIPQFQEYMKLRGAPVSGWQWAENATQHAADILLVPRVEPHPSGSRRTKFNLHKPHPAGVLS